MRSYALASAVLCACSATGGLVNFGATSSSATETPGSVEKLTPGADGAVPGDPEPTYVAPRGQCSDPGSTQVQNQDNVPSLPTMPADPWRAVTDGQPSALPLPIRRYRNASVFAREQIGPCTAANDHCLRDCSWMVKHDADNEIRQWGAVVSHRRPDGVFAIPSNPNGGGIRSAGLDGNDWKPGYEAFRTVPATKRMLEKGRIVAVKAAVPENEIQALWHWQMGTLLKVDYEAGTVQLEGSKDLYPLSATRVVVLTYRDGGAVEVAAGLDAKALAVKADETFAP